MSTSLNGVISRTKKAPLVTFDNTQHVNNMRASRVVNNMPR